MTFDMSEMVCASFFNGCEGIPLVEMVALTAIGLVAVVVAHRWRRRRHGPPGLPPGDDDEERQASKVEADQ